MRIAGPSSLRPCYTQLQQHGRIRPGEPYSANIVYGIDNVIPVRPFNRAEYYIQSAAAVPQRCAPNTGVLVKAVVAHDGTGTTPTLLPLLDCVADMQVVYGLDTRRQEWSTHTFGRYRRRDDGGGYPRATLWRSASHPCARRGSGTIPMHIRTNNVTVGIAGGTGRS